MQDAGCRVDFILHSAFFIRVAGGMREIWKICGYLRLFAGLFFLIGVNDIYPGKSG
jgi:hypothetical protein